MIDGSVLPVLLNRALLQVLRFNTTMGVAGVSYVHPISKNKDLSRYLEVSEGKAVTIRIESLSIVGLVVAVARRAGVVAASDAAAAGAHRHSRLHHLFGILPALFRQADGCGDETAHGKRYKRPTVGCAVRGSSNIEFETSFENFPAAFEKNATAASAPLSLGENHSNHFPLGDQGAITALLALSKEGPLYTMSESLSLHFAIILWFVFVFVEPPAAPNAADEDACPP